MISTNIYELCLQIINFLVLYWILKKVLFKPLVGFLENREQAIQDNIAKAQSNRTESEQLLAEQKKALKDARLEAQDIRKKADDAAELERESMLNKTAEDTKRMTENAKKEIDLSVQRVKQELTRFSGRLSVQLAEKILRTKLDAGTENQVVQDYMKQLK